MSEEVIKSDNKSILTTVEKKRFTTASESFIKGASPFLQTYLKQVTSIVDIKGLKEKLQNKLEDQTEELEEKQEQEKEMNKASNVIKSIMFVSVGILGGYLLFKDKMSGVLDKFKKAIDELDHLLNTTGNVLGRVEDFIRKITPDFSLTSFAKNIAFSVGWVLDTAIDLLAKGFQFFFLGGTQETGDQNVFVYLCKKILNQTAKNINEKSSLMKVLKLFGIEMKISVDTRVNLKKYVKFGGQMRREMKEMTDVGMGFLRSQGTLTRYLPEVHWAGLGGDEITRMLFSKWEYGQMINPEARHYWGADVKDSKGFEHFDNIDSDVWYGGGLGQKMSDLVKLAVEDAGGFVADNVRTDMLQKTFPSYDVGMRRLNNQWNSIKNLKIDSDGNLLQNTYYRGDDRVTKFYNLKNQISIPHGISNPVLEEMIQKMRDRANELNENRLTIYDIACLVYMATVSKLLNYWFNANQASSTYITDIQSGKTMYNNVGSTHLERNPFFMMRQRLRKSAQYNQMKQSFVQRTKELIMSGGVGVDQAFESLDYILGQWGRGYQMFKHLDLATMNVIDFGWLQLQVSQGFDRMHNAKRQYTLMAGGKNRVRIQNQSVTNSRPKTHTVERNIKEQRQQAEKENKQIYEWQSTNKVFGQIIYYNVQIFRKRVLTLRQRDKLMKQFKQVFEVFLDKCSVKSEKIELTDKQMEVLIKFAAKEYPNITKSDFIKNVRNQSNISTTGKSQQQKKAQAAKAFYIESCHLEGSMVSPFAIEMFEKDIAAARTKHNVQLHSNAATKFGFNKL